MARDGSAAHSITDGLDRSVDAFQWALDGRSLYLQYDDKGMTRIARVGLDSRLQPVAAGLAGEELDRPYTGGGFSVSDDGLVAFTLGGSDHPPDLAVAGRGGTRRLTRLNDDLFLGKSLGRVQALPPRVKATRPSSETLKPPPV